MGFLLLERTTQTHDLLRVLFVLLLCIVLPTTSSAQVANTKIAFVSTRDGNNEIYVMNADGSNPTNLTNNPAGDFSFSWPPDGTKIAVWSGRDGKGEVYVMNADGSNLNLVQ